MTIRTRLSLAFLLAIGIGFYLLVDRVINDLRPRYLATMEESMADTATVLASLLSTNAGKDARGIDLLRGAFAEAQRRSFLVSIYEVTKTNLNTRVYVTDRAGRVVFDSDGGRDEGKDFSRWNDVHLTLRGRYGARTTPTLPGDPRTDVLYVAAPVRAGEDIVGVLTVCKPAESVTPFLYAARRKIVIGSILAGVAAVAMGLAATLWITRPIRSLTAYAAAIRDGRKPPRPALGRNEIGALGNAFEEMRDALEGRRYAEQYVQALTHEMKSPLSALRGAAELLGEEMPPDRRARFLQNIRDETARIQNLVDRLLELSSLESRKELQEVEEVRLGDLADEVIRSAEPLLSAKRLTIEKQVDPAVAASGERFLLRQALANLLHNAVDFSPAAGRITLRVAREGDRVILSVADQGPGVPDYALAKVFERFYSLRHPDTGRKGTGLGLTFVREVALLHGGEARIENTPGGGAVASMVLRG